MPPNETPIVGRQRLGLRPGLVPYYQITTQTPTQVVLESHPNANARAGWLLLGCGGILLALAIVVLSSSYVSYAMGEGVNTLVAGLVGAMPCGILGMMGLLGGLTIASTRNRITIDRTDGTILYEQMNRLARARTQTLPLDRVVELRFSRRPFQPPGVMRTQRHIMVLELLTDAGHAWMVDSAKDITDLRPLGDALSEIIGLPVAEPDAADD